MTTVAATTPTPKSIYIQPDRVARGRSRLFLLQRNSAVVKALKEFKNSIGQHTSAVTRCLTSGAGYNFSLHQPNPTTVYRYTNVKPDFQSAAITDYLTHCLAKDLTAVIKRYFPGKRDPQVAVFAFFAYKLEKGQRKLIKLIDKATSNTMLSDSGKLHKKQQKELSETPKKIQDATYKRDRVLAEINRDYSNVDLSSLNTTPEDIAAQSELQLFANDRRTSHFSSNTIGYLLKRKGISTHLIYYVTAIEILKKQEDILRESLGLIQKLNPSNPLLQKKEYENYLPSQTPITASVPALPSSSASPLTAAIAPVKEASPAKQAVSPKTETLTPVALLASILTAASASPKTSSPANQAASSRSPRIVHLPQTATSTGLPSQPSAPMAPKEETTHLLASLQLPSNTHQSTIQQLPVARPVIPLSQRNIVQKSCCKRTFEALCRTIRNIFSFLFSCRRPNNIVGA